MFGWADSEGGGFRFLKLGDSSLFLPKPLRGPRQLSLLPRKSADWPPQLSIMTKWLIATDGTVFTDKDLYRKHEMETQYTFRDKKNIILKKDPGSVQGQPFVIDNCHKCKILLLDHCEQVQIDDVSDSKIFIGASSGSIFVRNCNHCTFTIACKQLRVRDCRNCTFNLYCKTEPAIEASTDMRFGPFNGAYPDHKKDMLVADLDPSINRWHAIYDFNDPSQNKDNWRYLLPEEQDPMWCPLGKSESCIPRDGCSPVNLPDDGNDSNDDDRDEIEPSTSSVEKESGFLHKIMVFGLGVWTVISHTVCSIQDICLGIIISGMQLPHKLLCYCDEEDDLEDKR